jgi:hypothetical protein
MQRGILPKSAKRASDNAIRRSVGLPGGCTNYFQNRVEKDKVQSSAESQGNHRTIAKAQRRTPS